MNEIAYHTMPNHSPQGSEYIRNYIEHGTVMPQFLMAVVEGDLFRALTEIDSMAIEYIHSLVLWLYTNAPAHCIGSRTNVALWVERGGRVGIMQFERDMQLRVSPFGSFHNR